MDVSWSKRLSQRLPEPPAELHGAHLGSSGRAFGVIRETIFGRKSVRRRPSCPGSDVLGLKSDANKFSDWKIWIGPKKRNNPKTRGSRAHIRTRLVRSQFFGDDAFLRAGKVEGPSLFQGRRMWPQASQIRRPCEACGAVLRDKVRRQGSSRV